MHDLPSKVLQKAVEQFASLPGVGYKTALRLTLHLLHRPKPDIDTFYRAFEDLSEKILFCKTCHNITDNTQLECDICLHPMRNKQVICVVENIKDLLAIERTGQFKGLYHILGGIISPMDGIGPSQLHIQSLVDRMTSTTPAIEEVILALPPSMEGDTTNFYLYKKLHVFSIKTSILARGIAVGNELEYTDEITLGKSIANRQVYEQTLKISV